MSDATRASEVARQLAEELDALSTDKVAPMRALRRRCSHVLRDRPADEVLEVARLVQRRYGRSWIAYELIRHHPAALEKLGPQELAELGEGMEGWGTVDAFAVYLAGPAWLAGQVPDALIEAWARSNDRWWRRAALVATVVLNAPSHGGRGDTERTLPICERLASDRDDMVVKALSWALRKLSGHDPDAVEAFLAEHEDVLAARVKREVRNKLETGLKNP